MTPQERQLIDDLFDRLTRLENAPRDAEAMSAIMQGLQKAPNAVYALVQTALVQDEALKRADSRIQELEAATSQQTQPGGFLDSMRDAIFGQSQQHGQGARFSAERSRTRDRRRAVRRGTPARCCSRASLPDSTVSRPTASPMAHSRRSSSRRSAAVAARFSAPRRRPPSAWSVARCWPAACVR